jgi:vacuolar protein sorting-associated protein 13A/C
MKVLWGLMFSLYLPFSLEPPALGIIFKNDNPDISSKPLQFTKVSHIVGKGIDEVFFWYPIAPPGYVSLGCVVSRTDEAPRADLFCCPRMDLVSQANINEAPLSRSSSSRAPQSWSIWKVENQVNHNFHFHECTKKMLYKCLLKVE